MKYAADIVAVFVVTGVIGLVSLWLATLYFRVTRPAEQHTVPFRARGIAKLLPVLIVMFTLVWSMFIGSEISRKVIYAFALLSLLGVITQILLILMTLFSEKCRLQLLGTVEGKLVGYVLLALAAIAKLVLPIFSFILGAAAAARTSDDAEKRSPYGYHGYLTDDEAVKRANGEDF